MSNSRVPSARRKTSRKAVSKTSKKQLAKLDPKELLAASGVALPLRFIGISLSGGKADKASLVVLDYFVEQKKIFLSRLYEKIKTEEFISADLKIHEIIHQYSEQLQYVAFDVPLSLPKCMTCRLKCPGYERCDENEIKWLRDFYQQVNEDKKPRKMFTPYTQRCIEAYISHGLEESFDMHHALGANQAPLLARAAFIKRRLQADCIESFPKLTVWRLGQDLKIAKSHLRHYRHAVGGDESRKLFLQAMADKLGLFIYQQDMRSMVDNYHSFEALICAYSAFLKYQNSTQSRPKNFPSEEAWIEFPKASG